ncbi:hypothetical protein BH09BAC6_BH09BAC6_02000 [soil metagenome]|jgi:hypothetical protein
MIPEEVYKRRRNHNNTPESILLIIANLAVFAVATELFAACAKINSIYWYILGALAIYNFFNIRKYREDYARVHVIAYIISIAGIVLMFFLLRARAQHC